MKTINHECYVSLEVAKLLKKAGFNWECKMIHFCYVEDDYMWNLEDNDKKARSILELDYCLLAPTLDVAQRWLREVKNISIAISSTNYSEYKYIIRKVNQSHYSDNTILALTACGFYTYEEAQEAGIKKALEIILEKRE